MVGLLSKLRGENRTPVEVGLTMLVVNMILVGGFALSIGAIVLLSLIGVPIPPFVVILSFAVASLFLWVYLGKSFPQSFSVLGICQSMVIGVGESPNPRSNAPRPLEVGPRRRCSFADPGLSWLPAPISPSLPPVH